MKLLKTEREQMAPAVNYPMTMALIYEIKRLKRAMRNARRLVRINARDAAVDVLTRALNPRAAKGKK